MKRIHIALAVKDLDQSIAEYTQRLGAKPVSVVANTYALWRTPQVNFSISVKEDVAPGTLRHLGFEDPEALQMDVEKDCNGLEWERFTWQQQKDEIYSYWPDATYE